MKNVTHNLKYVMTNWKNRAKSLVQCIDGAELAKAPTNRKFFLSVLFNS